MPILPICYTEKIAPHLLRLQQGRVTIFSLSWDLSVQYNQNPTKRYVDCSAAFQSAAKRDLTIAHIRICYYQSLYRCVYISDQEILQIQTSTILVSLFFFNSIVPVKGIVLFKFGLRNSLLLEFHIKSSI